MKPETLKPEEILQPQEPKQPKPTPIVEEVTPETKTVARKDPKLFQKSQKPKQNIAQKSTELTKAPYKPAEQTLAQKVEQEVLSNKKVSEQESNPVVQMPSEGSEPRILGTAPEKEDSLPFKHSNVSTNRVDVDSNTLTDPSSVGAKPEELSPAGEDSDLLTDPIPRYSPRPEYPREARRFGWEGTVLLIVEVLPDGNTGKIKIKESSGHSVLDRQRYRRFASGDLHLPRNKELLYLPQ